MDIIQLISSLGFPIVACIFIAIWTAKQNDNYRTDIKELQREHKEEINQVTEALNNNTLVLQKLCDKLDNEKRGDGA